MSLSVSQTTCSLMITSGLLRSIHVRMRRRAAVSRTNYVYAPRTSFLIGRLLGKSRER